MTDIVEFLTARLDEDEAGALATTPVPVPGRWKVARDKHADDDDPLQLIQGDDPDDPASEEYSSTEIIACNAYWQNEAEANLRHIARHDPARVLAEVAAKRRLLARHFADQDGSCVGCGFDSMEGRRVEDIDDCPELRDMASVYDSHPGHKQEWKPIVEFVRREDYFSRPPALPPGWAIATQAPDAQEGVNLT